MEIAASFFNFGVLGTRDWSKEQGAKSIVFGAGGYVGVRADEL
ncbi:MAG: hypothetical protein ACJATN_000430 [Neolewinella sp.]|jgi:hypothetical protein